MDNRVGVVDEVVQNLLVNGVSESRISSDLPVSNEQEGDEVFEEAEEAISDYCVAFVKEDSNDGVVPSISSNFQGLEIYDISGVLADQHDDEVMQDAIERHSSEESYGNGVTVLVDDYERDMVMAKEKLYDADAEEMSHNGMSDGPITCESMEEVSMELKGEASADQNHTHEKDGLAGETTESGSIGPKEAMLALDAQHHNGILSVDPFHNIDDISGKVKHVVAPSLSEQKEGSKELKDRAHELSTSFESRILTSKAKTSDSSDVSTILENKEDESDSLDSHKSCNLAEVGRKGGEGERVDEGNLSKQVSTKSEIKSTNSVLPLVHSAGLVQAVPILEPGPRVQQPWYNGASSISWPPRVQSIEDVGNGEVEEGGDDTREKLQKIRVKFLRLAHRLGQTPHNVVVAHLNNLEANRAGAFSYDRASAMAEQLEHTEKEPINFSCTIMVLGKTGVGKSANINSIFDEEKFSTNAFGYDIKNLQEVEGNTVHGIKVWVIDTPGLLQSWSDQQKNEKTLLSVKRFLKKSLLDIVLYLDRLDMPSRDSGDMALLRTITNYRVFL
ncbi:LOW QUALITY PROTEIN: hypothetical protein V2J09_015531 [Rumex salicifolius]